MSIIIYHHLPLFHIHIRCFQNINKIYQLLKYHFVGGASYLLKSGEYR